MNVTLWSLIAVSKIIFLSGCQISLPRPRAEEVAIKIKGDEEGYLRAHLIKELAFSGYNISASSQFKLEIEEITSNDRNLGFRRGSSSKNAGVKASEADLILSARATLIDTHGISRVLANKTLRVWTCFDFASDHLSQEQLSYSRGALTTQSEARKFAHRELRHKMARAIAGWMESTLQKDHLQLDNLQTAFSQSGAD